MQILMLVDEKFYPKIGGSAFEQWEFARRTAQAGHDITVVAPRESGESAEELVDGVRIRRPIRSHQRDTSNERITALLWRLVYTLGLFVDIVFWLRRNDATVVYSTAYMTHPVAKLAGMVFGVPAAGYVQTVPTERAEGKLERVLLRVSERFVHRYCLGRVVFCKLERVRAQLEREAGNSPEIELLHPTFNSDAVQEVAERLARSTDRPTPPVKGDGVTLCYVGRFVPVKNIDLIVETLEELPERYSLVLVGDGPEFARISQEIESRGIEERVEMTGALPHEAALEVIATSHALLLTSDSEVDPTVVYEALALNTHVFARPVGTVSDIAHDRLDVVDTSKLAAAIQATDLENRPAGTDSRVIDRFGIAHFVEAVLTKLDGISSPTDRG